MKIKIKSVFIMVLLSISTFIKSGHKETTIESYDSSASEYYQNVVSFDLEAKVARFISYLTPGASILDVGCGPGIDAKYFISQGFSVTGIDLSSSMIELARCNAQAATFYIMDIENINLPEAQFDAIWAYASLLHIEKQNLPNILQKFKSLLKEDGILYIALKKGEGEVLTQDNRYQGESQKFWAYYQKDELIDYLENAGFVVLESEVSEISTAYQTHPWIKVVCKKKVSDHNVVSLD